MSHLLAPSDQLGYCTNVHAGVGITAIRGSLEQHALAVKAQFSPHQPMGVGLWFSAQAAQELVATPQGVAELSQWLGERGLLPFTLNGFPYGDFHQAVVKHLVYLPSWQDQQRLRYTCQLVDILHGLLPLGLEGSISTLPLQWGTPAASKTELDQAAQLLREAAWHMAQLEAATGRLIHLNIEPEPGCSLDRGEDIVRFFQHHLLVSWPDNRASASEQERIIRRHLRVCHDVCHSMVMFEEQADVLRTYQAAGIDVGKIQVSSAVLLPLDELPAGDRSRALAQLAQFVEPRYLHQTMVRLNGKDHFFEDLPLALAALGDKLAGEWRTHFHVPIYLEQFGLVQTSRPQILQCLAAAKKFTSCRHFEAETYAWGVLPPELKHSTLAAGIAAEMHWLANV